ncbi:MAG: metallophosphoesterase [Oligoflexia bacterium]|nr:metallophosphoesterase [Oligoflexia bacterium]
MHLIVVGLAILGHGMLWIGILNRLHARAIALSVLGCIELFIIAWTAIFCWLLFSYGINSNFGIEALPFPLKLYISLTLAILVLGAGHLAWLRTRPAPSCLLAASGHCVDVVDQLGFIPTGSGLGSLLTSASWNECFKLEITHKTLRLPRLPETMSGFRIVQWSDMHFTGSIGREYFEFVAEETRRLAPHMIVITGDFHNTWECRDWFKTTVGNLKAPEGVYFILGNHDLRSGQCNLLRSLLQSFGLIYVGGKALSHQTAGGRILLAGNELPWIKPAPVLDSESSIIAMGEAEFGRTAYALRLLLSHSPDQIAWARRHKFDLILAGHTHGGQICLPLIGPILCPSSYGTRFAGGVFELGDSIMHVTRGLSGGEPIRFRCLPELACLELRTTSETELYKRSR